LRETIDRVKPRDNISTIRRSQLQVKAKRVADKAANFTRIDVDTTNRVVSRAWSTHHGDNH
jgi:hypothetical protein